MSYNEQQMSKTVRTKKFCVTYIVEVIMLPIERALFAVLGLLSAVHVNSLWHAYDAFKTYEPQCIKTEEEFKRQTKPVSQANKDKWKLWPDVISQQDLTEGETLYGFEEAMEAIWKHQHPANCSDAKYLISGGFESGFGSEFHVIGVGLALAMNMNRVFIMFPDKMDSSLMDKMSSVNNRFQVDIEYCRKQGKPNLECYYEPWTHCTIQDALQGSSLAKLRTTNQHLFMDDLVKLDNPPQKAFIAQHTGTASEIMPKVLYNTYACSPMHVGKYRYWWRAVTAAFLMRPNEPTRQMLLQHRQDKEMVFDKEKEKCVSVYVRRGDKHLEMKMIDDETMFFEGARTLWTNLKNQTTQPKPVMFVGS